MPLHTSFRCSHEALAPVGAAGRLDAVACVLRPPDRLRRAAVRVLRFPMMFDCVPLQCEGTRARIVPNVQFFGVQST